ncbi:contact-dependent growth inhibition system immunity protein [Nissabacter sp. SGAir0207]|uniref:contact-dependent growth inhibition system immunity protein n=1 Tax=Nissabacter sp. SGAir0207 TaxID=2126321 RepID=UPI0010CD5D83|nr:contact-dependent growth inhibition system immunity protein [Nissabacter sp. SGAir0207]QCR38774.1 hypothetical protein C1N62_21850 [Nissabacter sp. SGAir0207]
MTTATIERYPHLDELMMGFINQDAESMAGSDKYADMLKCYFDVMDRDLLPELLKEIEAYQAEHSDNLVEDFARDFPYGYRVSEAEEFFSLLKGGIVTQIDNKEKYQEEAAAWHRAFWTVSKDGDPSEETEATVKPDPAKIQQWLQSVANLYSVNSPEFVAAQAEALRLLGITVAEPASQTTPTQEDKSSASHAASSSAKPRKPLTVMR